MIVFWVRATVVGIIVLGCMIAARPTHSSAALTGDQVAILANRNSTEGMDVARHYAARRKVPSDHIIELSLPTDETISRSQYEDLVLRPVRHALVNRHLASKIRAVVTTYGIPLRVASRKPSPTEEKWTKDAGERRRFAESYLERANESMSRIASSADSARESSSSDDTKQTKSDSAQPIGNRLEETYRSVTRRLKDVRDRKQLEQGLGELARLTKAIGGDAALVQKLAPSATADRAQAEADLAKLKRQLTWASQAIEVLTTFPGDENRERAYKLSEQYFGLLGVLRLATLEQEITAQKDSDGSLDSELSLLWWDLDQYSLAGRLQNPLYYAERKENGAGAPSVPLLMVSRLDGPTPLIAKQLVDQALTAEQQGLKGKVYVDARGLDPEPAPRYGFYDQSLRELAELFKKHTPYTVVSENTDKRFARAGEAPDVAVYVGWYRLRSYEDAFQFNTGAIGYHIASGEAISLHDSTETGWCKNALEHGITATLGSTGEPYVDSFPTPIDFFGLLLTGRYSLVEVYYLTARHVSWRMTLIGDPLYNPWRGKQYVTEQTFSQGSADQKQVRLPQVPSDLPFTDPPTASRALRQKRQALLDQVDQALRQSNRPADTGGSAR
jgi:uncharacterized protein (TIGR03790 family)